MSCEELKPQSIQPDRHHAMRLARQLRAEAYGVCAQCCNIDLCGGEFVHMADQPTLEAGSACFREKLESDDVRSEREGLISTKRSGGKQRGAFGNVERVVVPVQRRRILHERRQT